MNLMLLFMAIIGCEPGDPCAAARDLMASPGGLVITPEEHELGWGRTECFQCHQSFRIHQADCASVVAVDGEAIEERVDVSDTTTCVECHGSNGVAEWDSLLDSGDTAR